MEETMERLRLQLLVEQRPILTPGIQVQFKLRQLHQILPLERTR